MEEVCQQQLRVGRRGNSPAKNQRNREMIASGKEEEFLEGAWAECQVGGGKGILHGCDEGETGDGSGASAMKGSDCDL